MPWTNLRVEQVCYAEIKRSDWLEIVMGFGSVNQLLHNNSIAMLLWNLLMTYAQDLKVHFVFSEVSKSVMSQSYIVFCKNLKLSFNFVGFKSTKLVDWF